MNAGAVRGGPVARWAQCRRTAGNVFIDPVPGKRPADTCNIPHQGTGILKKGILFFFERDIDAVFPGIPVRNGLDERDFGILPFRFEEVPEPFLGL